MFRTVVILILAFANSTQAVEVAPRISDREIIESLAEIKATIKTEIGAVNQRFETINERFEAVNQRFEAVNQRFDEVDKRFDMMEKQTKERFDAMEKQTNVRFDAVNQRFDAVDQRFDQMDKQFDKIWNLMLVIIAGIFGLIGFIVWDRKTALKPLEQRLDRIENELHHDLEIQHEQGSRMTRLVNALRELAQTDPKVAGVLRSFSLL
jgi:cytochrome c-type biogenesis protein CcmH/NrfG